MTHGNFLKKRLCRHSTTLYFIILLLTFSFYLGIRAIITQAASQKDISPPTTYGSWIKVCSLPPGTLNVMCELVQIARAKDRADISFRVSFIKLPRIQGTLLRVIVPIRVELPFGVGIQIDNEKDLENLPYRRCFGGSCVAEALLADKDMQNFLDGKSATFFIFTTPEESIGAVMDLTGIRAGYDALKIK